MPPLNRLGMHAPLYLVFHFPENAAAVDSALFVCDDAYELVEARETHITAGSDSGAVTLQIVKAASGTAIADGTDMLATTFNLKSTAATPVTRSVGNGGVSQTLATRQLIAGDTLYAQFTGTMTGYLGGSLQLVLKRLTFTTER